MTSTQRFFVEFAQVRFGTVHAWVPVGVMSAADAERFGRGRDPSMWRKSRA